MTDPRAAAETAARTAYGKLVAILAARTRDVAAAQDALADAFRAALEAWPRTGVPDRPEAWLLTAARRAEGHRRRHRDVTAAARPTLETLATLAEDTAEAPTASDIPDERLALMFVCAHPEIDPAARAPLMLQTVLGLEAARIASAWLVPPSTMSQRLVRAKGRIREAGLRFAVPDRAELPDRLDAVLEALYAAFGRAFEEAPGADPRAPGLTEESLYLASVLAGLLPDEAEAHGLLALMRFVAARAPARRGADGAYVPLSDQDPARWDAALLRGAEAALARGAALAAAGRAPPGRFGIEAAIQSIHVYGRLTGEVPPPALLAGLYDALAALSPAPGVLVARAASVGAAQGPAAGLALLDASPAEFATYQPAWAVRAHLLALAGDRAGADDAYRRAIGLAEDPSVRAFLAARRAELGDAARG